ncbi:MAG TPA: molybdopterin-guanine dinucleotide biosynthesis protein MobB, partial [Thermoanaerobaculia bacterium]|nr:molybdopterin-guanine dinucleotide biosynthesis protein MobB [Thermoanaerobaculia bacterium]
MTAYERVVGVAGWSGSGKTTLLERVVPALVADGLSVVVVKHDAHGLALDVAGKDSDRLFRAGAEV